MTTTKNDITLLKIHEVQEIFEDHGVTICLETIRRYTRTGKLPCVRSPKWLLFKRADVYAMLNGWGIITE